MIAAYKAHQNPGKKPSIRLGVRMTQFHGHRQDFARNLLCLMLKTELAQRERKMHFGAEPRIVDETQRREAVAFRLIELPTSPPVVGRSLEFAHRVADRGHH